MTTASFRFRQILHLETKRDAKRCLFRQQVICTDQTFQVYTLDSKRVKIK